MFIVVASFEEDLVTTASVFIDQLYSSVGEGLILITVE